MGTHHPLARYPLEGLFLSPTLGRVTDASDVVFYPVRSPVPARACACALCLRPPLFIYVRCVLLSASPSDCDLRYLLSLVCHPAAGLFASPAIVCRSLSSCGVWLKE